MKNYQLFKIKSKINLNIRGSNIYRFIKRLKDNNIDILNIIYLSKDEINIKIYDSDYNKLMKLKTVYEVNILNYQGIINTKKRILNNKYIIISTIVCFILLYISCNLIFYIDIISNDKDMANMLMRELNNLGIKKYNFKKNYNELQEIKKEILSKYKDKIQWIEIENIGTKYIVKYEPKIITEYNTNNVLRNIVAKKDSVIKKLYISSGQIVKNINTYVKKGDVIVSGYIDLNGDIKNIVSASGSVYGEVWYNVSIDYPYKYYEEINTGNSKNILSIYFLNKKIDIFNFNKYKTYKVENKTLIRNNILPIKLIQEHQIETNIIDENNTEEELTDKAIEYTINKIKDNLSDGEYIYSYKILSKTKKENSIAFNIFLSVIENIADYKSIENNEQ